MRAKDHADKRSPRYEKKTPRAVRSTEAKPYFRIAFPKYNVTGEMLHFDAVSRFIFGGLPVRRERIKHTPEHSKYRAALPAIPPVIRFTDVHPPPSFEPKGAWATGDTSMFRGFESYKAAVKKPDGSMRASAEAPFSPSKRSSFVLSRQRFHLGPFGTQNCSGLEDACDPASPFDHRQTRLAKFPWPRRA